MENINEILEELETKRTVSPVITNKDIELVKFWNAPAKNGAKLLTMPNIPTPLQGPGCQPRTIFGASAWNKIRKKCYADADYHCEACGKDCHDSTLHAHEVYNINYKEHTVTFIRVVALCPLCHLGGIHTGRNLTLYKRGVPYVTKQSMLDGAENAFTIISAYNKTHKRRLKAFSTFVDYSRQPELHDEMERLIKKYDMEFYRINEKSWCGKNWNKWKLIIDGVEYPTPYETREDWEKAMEKNNDNNRINNSKLSFSEELNKIIDEIENKH